MGNFWIRKTTLAVTELTQLDWKQVMRRRLLSLGHNVKIHSLWLISCWPVHGIGPAHIWLQWAPLELPHNPSGDSVNPVYRSWGALFQTFSLTDTPFVGLGAHFPETTEIANCLWQMFSINFNMARRRPCSHFSDIGCCMHGSKLTCLSACPFCRWLCFSLPQLTFSHPHTKVWYGSPHPLGIVWSPWESFVSAHVLWGLLKLPYWPLDSGYGNGNCTLHSSIQSVPLCLGRKVPAHAAVRNFLVLVVLYMYMFLPTGFEASLTHGRALGSLTVKGVWGQIASDNDQ